MSKAFVKEDSDQDDQEDLEANALLKSLPTKKNYITPVGFARLKGELHELLHKTRPDLTQVVAWAASNGDRSENADYQYGKKRLREIDRRIRFLTKRLEIAEVIDPALVNAGGKVQFGATVTFKATPVDEDQSVIKTVAIVGIDEIDPAHGKISWISPLAKVLLGQMKGDVVSLRLPKGEEELEIIKIEYKLI